MTPINQPLRIRQNSDGSIRVLSANCRLYGIGKRFLALQMFLTVGLAILLPTLIWIYPNYKPVAALIAITVAWLDVTVVDRLQIYYRKLGALGQEQFDCELFDIEWNELRCGKRIPGETLNNAAEAFQQSNSTERLRDWYAEEVDALPLDLAALASQRLSLGWDCGQRFVFGYILWGLAIAALVGVAFWAICCMQTVEDTLLITYASIAPAIMWSAREGRRHLEAARSLEKARVVVDKAWQDAVCGKLGGDRLRFTIRQIQDAMFENRSKAPMIFDWIYFLLRTRREKVMKLTAADLVLEWSKR